MGALIPGLEEYSSAESEGYNTVLVLVERRVSYKVDIGNDFKVPRQPEASEELESVLVMQCRPECVLVRFGPIET